MIDSYRHVFATMFWFAVLPGPVGAVLYRFLQHSFFQKWGMRDSQFGDLFGRFAYRAQKPWTGCPPG